MLILGIDTSAKVCSVAVTEDGKVLFSRTLSDGLTHSETLLPLIKTALESAEKKISDLSAIAITCGPGSFTGLRIGISTVKGLAIANNIPCASISTLEALAYNGMNYEGSLICACMDARRGEYYNALFRVEDSSLIRVTEDRALPGDEIYSEICNEEKVLVVGDGAEKFVSEHTSFVDFLAPIEIRLQSGVSVAKLGEEAAKEGKMLSCAELSPIYLRLPQAEREWLLKNKQSEVKK